MPTEITTAEEARAIILAVSDYLLACRDAEPPLPPFSTAGDENPTEKLTRELCHELLSSGISRHSNCDLCGS